MIGDKRKVGQMLLLLISVALVIVGVILLVVGYKKDLSDFVGGIGVVFSIIGGFILIYTLIGVADSHINQEAELQAKLAEREALVYQLENGTYDGSTNAVGTFNAEVILNKGALENPWINWETATCYRYIEPINLEEY